MLRNANVAKQLMCKHECYIVTNALRAKVFDDYSSTQFQLRSRNYVVQPLAFILQLLIANSPRTISAATFILLRVDPHHVLAVVKKTRGCPRV